MCTGYRYRYALCVRESPWNEPCLKFVHTFYGCINHFPRPAKELAFNRLGLRTGSKTSAYLSTFVVVHLQQLRDLVTSRRHDFFTPWLRSLLCLSCRKTPSSYHIAGISACRSVFMWKCGSVDIKRQMTSRSYTLVLGFAGQRYSDDNS